MSKQTAPSPGIDTLKQTRDNYDAAWKKLAALSNSTFRELRTAQLQEQIDRIANMSASTLSKVKALLTQLYDYALQNDIIDKNYAKFIRLPKKEKVSKDCFTDLELKKIEQAVDVVPWADVILMMCYTGFRVTEFLTLTPHCYDQQAGTLTGSLKTDAGRNRIDPVHHKIKTILEEWISRGREYNHLPGRWRHYDSQIFQGIEILPGAGGRRSAQIIPSCYSTHLCNPACHRRSTPGGH